MDPGSDSLAWNGLIGFYVPITVFVGWLVMTTILLLRSIDRQEREIALVEAAGVEPERVAA